MQRLVQHRALEVAPFLGVPGADDIQIESHIEAAKLAAQARRLSAALWDLSRLDHEQVEIRVRPGLTSGA
jgi:hypothetical protein